MLKKISYAVFTYIMKLIMKFSLRNFEVRFPRSSAFPHYSLHPVDPFNRFHRVLPQGITLHTKSPATCTTWTAAGSAETGTNSRGCTE